MGISEHSLKYKKTSQQLIASIRQPVADRPQIRGLFAELEAAVPAENRAGDFFWINHYINSLEEGSDVEVGIPVKRPVNAGRVSSRTLPPMQFLTFIHDGPADTIAESYQQIRSAAAELGLISDEFRLESFEMPDNLLNGPIEIQFVLHDWAGLFKDHLARVLGEPTAGQVFGDMDTITIDTPLQDRSRLTCQAVSRLAARGDEFAAYDVVSSCAHVFPDTQTAKLSQVYQAALKAGGDKIAAIDAVLAFMAADPGWKEESYREGETIYSAKNPCDQAAYAAAQTDAERRKAACFCPVVRGFLEEGIPPTYCYCGSGWYRKQWQDASGKPVSIQVVKSLVKGNDRCQFAITIQD